MHPDATVLRAAGPRVTQDGCSPDYFQRVTSALKVLAGEQAAALVGGVVSHLGGCDTVPVSAEIAALEGLCAALLDSRRDLIAAFDQLALDHSRMRDRLAYVERELQNAEAGDLRRFYAAQENPVAAELAVNQVILADLDRQIAEKVAEVEPDEPAEDEAN
ncbi:hypothetical protein ASA1KI_39650 [Opitutales bacterium ASA1]|uniref:hypothetical protein n=1 Tax=Congregicoccus parvus TaxID=3081749 RepID=UPI002B2ED4B8|nr:hypothetical protein ASA1KI_39650 [Opitutales bacterium ASA1]